MPGTYRQKNSDANRALAYSAALVFGAQMLVNISNFLFHVIVSRGVGVVAYGTLNALVSAFQVAQAPALIAVTILAKYTAELTASQGSAAARTLQRSSMRVLGIAAAATLVCGGLAAPPIARYLNISATLPVLLMLAILALNFVLPIRGVFQGLERFREYSLSLICEAGVKLALAAIFIWIGWGIDGALGGWCGGCVIAFLYLLKTSDRSAYAEDTVINTSALVRTVAFVSIAMTCVTSLGFSDVVLAKHFFAPETAGLYGAAAMCGKMLYFMVYAIPAVLLPRVAAMNAVGSRTRIYLFGSLGAVAAISMFGLTLYWFAGTQVVTLLAGREFASAGSLIFPYGVISVLSAMLNTAVTYRIAVGGFRFLPGLAVIAVAAIASLCVWHNSPLQFIESIALADLLALCLLVGLPAVEKEAPIELAAVAVEHDAPGVAVQSV